MYHILIVEDEAIELAVLKKVISNSIEGAEIFTANTGREAVEWIDKLTKIDLMLVDINIPLPNGLEVIRYLREKSKETKILVITANDDIDMARNMFSLKVDDYLLKPVKTQDLVECVKRTLSFDEEKELTLKQDKALLLNYLENFEYSLWAEYLIDDLLKERSSGHLVDLFYQIIQHKELSIPYFSKNKQQLNSTAYNCKNFYKIIRLLMQITNDIFDLAYKQNDNKIEPIKRAQYYIDRHIFQDVNLDDVADKTFISTCYLSRLYKKHFGISFSQYVAERKIELAKILLRHSDLQINQIALELSYNDVNYFCRLFKKVTEITPSDYRAKFESVS
ncbi:hypothetical protein A1D22_04355 [Pasteurellaceae bacterium LFhippo2]|nr:hypothetical protein [Pasteurellaceae bacterium LFhippo2]